MAPPNTIFLGLSLALRLHDQFKASHWPTLLPHPQELLKAEDVKTHICARFSRICAKFRLLRAKLVKQALFLCFLTKSDKVKKKYSSFL